MSCFQIKKPPQKTEILSNIGAMLQQNCKKQNIWLWINRLHSPLWRNWLKMIVISFRRLELILSTKLIRSTRRLFSSNKGTLACFIFGPIHGSREPSRGNQSESDKSFKNNQKKEVLCQSRYGVKSWVEWSGLELSGAEWSHGLEWNLCNNSANF